MGIKKCDIEFLCSCKEKYSIDFESIAMLGRQNLYLYEQDARTFIEKYGEENCDIDAVVKQWFSCYENGSYYSEPVLQWLGAKNITSFDYSCYEGASAIWDFNKKIPRKFRAKYSLVYDGGTLEHVFQYGHAAYLLSA